MVSVWHVVVGLLLIAYIFAFAVFFGYLLYGPGIDVKIPSYFASMNGTTTAATSSEQAGEPLSLPLAPPAPPPASASLAEFSGTLYQCEGERAFKAEFREGSVRLSLSDGRGLIVPQTGSSEGGATYANTDGSFTFEVQDSSGFLNENSVATYANCTMVP